MAGLLAPKPPKPEPVVIPPAPAPTPLPDSQALTKARKKEVVAQSQRGGRMSTILTDTGNETLGG